MSRDLEERGSDEVAPLGERIVHLFGWNDLVVIGMIILAGTLVVHETILIEPENPYPTTIFYALTNIAQVVAPIMALALGALFYLRVRHHRLGEGLLLKGTLLLAMILLISLLMLPLVDILYARPGVWQGVITTLLLLGVWSLTLTILGMFRTILSDASSERRSHP